MDSIFLSDGVGILVLDSRRGDFQSFSQDVKLTLRPLIHRQDCTRRELVTEYVFAPVTAPVHLIAFIFYRGRPPQDDKLAGLVHIVPLGAAGIVPMKSAVGIFRHCIVFALVVPGVLYVLFNDYLDKK